MTTHISKLIQKPINPKEMSSTHILQLENLLLRDEDIFQTSLNSEDYLESLAPIIKEAIGLNGLSNLILKLNDIVKNKDEELINLSMSSTDEINLCIDKIDNIHDESAELNQNLSLVSQHLNKSVYELIAKKKNLTKSKEVSTKINETNIVLNLCVQVLEITNKIHDLIAHKKYFNALKLIDELVNIHVPKVENFSFALKIRESIPHLTQSIKDESFGNLDNWVSVVINGRLGKISEQLFGNLYDLQKNWSELKKVNTTIVPHRLNSPVELSLRDPLLNYKVFDDKELDINLGVVYDGILVYLTLNELELLSTQYNKEWLQKYNKIIRPITLATEHKNDNTVFTTLPKLEEYLQRIATFFILDKQLNLVTKFQLRSNLSSNDLWASYVTKLKPALLAYLRAKKFKNVEELTEFKDILGDFLQIMEIYNFDILELYEVLIIVFRDFYAPLLILEFRTSFVHSIQSDHYMPLVIDLYHEYETISQYCWYPSDAYFAPPKTARDMPIAFPFSEDYVHFCYGIHKLLDDIIQFTGEHYGYDLNELNNIIVNDVFEKVLSDKKGHGIGASMHEFIDKNSTNKEITSQSYTNLEYYLFSLYEIGKLINRRLRIHTGIGVYNNDGSDTNGGFVLRAVDQFIKLRKYSETAIFEMVDGKIKELLELLEYDDWLPSQKNNLVSFSIQDFSLYLENLFTSIFSSLPSSIKTLGLFRTYDFVSEHFLKLLQDVTTFNKIAIENFDLDIQHIETSMKNLYHQSKSDTEFSGNVALESTFTELRQYIDLLKLDDYDSFTRNPTFRMRNFDRIRYEDGLALLSKMQGFKFEELEPVSTTDETNILQGDQMSILSSAATKNFAKFSSKFRKNTELQ